MVHAQTVREWAGIPDFPAALRRWTWCREAWPAALRHAGDGSPVQPVPAAQFALAFWPWVAALDHQRALEPLDRVDFAHYACGLLLSRWLVATQAPPAAAVPRAEAEARIVVLTGLALTVLAAWRAALGAPPLEAPQAVRDAHWHSYRENISEDPGVAAAFLDLFTGREPMWRYPLILTERPAMRRALEARRTASGA